MQRVSQASVSVDGRPVGQIDGGLLALVAVTHSDTRATATALARKIFGLRILPGERSVAEVPGAGLLVVSQFTLYGDARKGRRPTWTAAAPGELAEPLIDHLVAELRALADAAAAHRPASRPGCSGPT